MRLFAATLLTTFLLCASARADDVCAAIPEIVRGVEEAGFTGAYAEGAFIYAGRVHEECRVAMADALAAYRGRISHTLAGPAHTRYRHWLLWEEAKWAGNGQLYARAADLTRQAMAEQHNQPDAYFAAIAAFLERDRAAYDAAHLELTRDVQTRYYSRGVGIAISAGDGLIASSEALGLCWDRPFSEAFSLACSGDVMTRLIRERQSAGPRN
jgi:hypothetical protein